MKKLLAILVCAGILIFPGISSATTIVDLIGDMDAAFFPDAGDPVPTDSELNGNATWSHLIDLSGMGSLTEATLELNLGDPGWSQGDMSIDVNGTTVGSNIWADFQWIVVTFDLLALIDNTTTIVTVEAFADIEDYWYLDYSKLTISDEVSVPEPSTLLLLGSGLIGLAFFRRKTEIV